MKLREYCCCAIPTVNVGMYITLTEQLVLGIAVGAISLATPDIVGYHGPGFADVILGCVAFAGAALQVLGIIGVARESPAVVKRFVGLHLLVLTVGFAVAATWTIMSAISHTDAKADCQADFFDANNSAQDELSDTLCEIFPWVDVGIMGGLWVLLAALQLYLYFVMLSYSSYLQDKEGGKYGTLETIPMKAHADAWDSRPSNDNPYYPGPSSTYPPQPHRRGNSTTSMSDVMSEPVHQPRDGYRDYAGTGYPQTQVEEPHEYGHPPSAQGHPNASYR